MGRCLPGSTVGAFCLTGSVTDALPCCLCSSTGRIAGRDHLADELVRRILTGGRHDHSTRQTLQQLLAFGSGLIQTVFNDLRVKEGAGHQIDLLTEGHVAHNGQAPALGQGRALMQIMHSAAAGVQGHAPARGRAVHVIRRSQADVQLPGMPDPEGKGEVHCPAITLIKRPAGAVGHGHAPSRAASQLSAVQDRRRASPASAWRAGGRLWA